LTKIKNQKPFFDPIQYKKNTKENWNAVAPEYHHNWADKHVGPFMSTSELVKLAEIGPNDKVLDVACGTGVVSKEISRLLGKHGLLLGIDLSRIAIRIARKSIKIPNVDFVEMDVEKIGLKSKFDKVTCQFGLMFFPEAEEVLSSIRKILKPQGKLVLAVHGLPDEVPYFSVIMNSILKYIPEIRPKGTPTVHRFGNPEELRSKLTNAKFTDVYIKRHNFVYTPGTFDEYWDDYMNSTANCIRAKIESYGLDTMYKIKKESRESSLAYKLNGRIVFPWAVLIAAVSNQT
jgi:ubiquinone/menaquinone biosynthesis C-methylase UbiE